MQTLTLPDGRRLGYEIYGDPDGFPVIYCHGFPASRLEARLFHEDARDTGVMLVAADRPGYGGSDYQAGRRMPDWAGDMGVLADGLRLDRYSVMGISGGAPYAVHCAAAGDARLHRLGLVCGLGPMDKPETLSGMGSPAKALVTLARTQPGTAIQFYSRVMGPLMFHHPGWVMSILTFLAPESDKAVYSDETLKTRHLDAVREAFVQGGRGPAWDLHLYTRAWGLDLDDVRVDAWLWHGNLDRTVPVAMGYYYAEHLPRVHAEFVAGEGHFSLPVRRMRDILRTLADGRGGGPHMRMSSIRTGA